MISQRSLLAVASAVAAVSLPSTTFAEAVDFSTFTSHQGVQANTMAVPAWQVLSSYNNHSVDPNRVVQEPGNSDTTLFIGPSTLTTQNKVITGDIYFGNDDDYVGLALGVPQDPFTNTASDYLLLQWKGLPQNFDFHDVPGSANFHNTTVGGAVPMGLSLSRVSGVPTADEFWQRSNLVMYDPGTKTTPDPNTDPPTGFDTGGLTELGRGAVSGNSTFDRFTRQTKFEITYTPSHITVLVNGVVEFDMDAPVGTLFPEGTLALYEQGQDGNGAFGYFDVREIGTAAPAPAPDLSPVGEPYAAADVSVTVGNTNATSIWSVARGTSDASGTGTAITIVPRGNPPSTGNIGDAEFALNGTKPTAATGVFINTVRQNGPRENGTGVSWFGGAEAPSPSGFGSTTGAGLATFPYGTNTNGQEWNVDIGTVHLPYAQFHGGYVGYNSTSHQAMLVSTDDNSAYNLQTVKLAMPTQVQYDPNNTTATGFWNAGLPENNQVVSNLQIIGKNSATSPGILFTVGASNESNTTGAAVQADGSWNISVRDSWRTSYGGPDTFEEDDFAFVYVEPGQIADSVGARVTGFNQGAPQVAQTWGSYIIDHVSPGVYELVIPGGETYTINSLEMKLSGDIVLGDTSTSTAPVNNQTISPEYSDTAFSVGFMPFTPGDPSSGMLMLTNNGTFTMRNADDTADVIVPTNHFLTYQLGGIPTWQSSGSGNWSEAAHWRVGVPNSGAASANLSHSINTPSTVTLDTSATVQNLYFNSPQKYTIVSNGAGTTSLNVAGSIGAYGGSHEIAAPVNLTAPVQIGVGNDSALKISGPLTGKLSGIAIAPTGQLNLGTNDIIVDYTDVSPEQQLRQYVIDGRRSGNGITTEETPEDDTVLAIVDNVDWGRTRYNGIDIDTSTVIGKYTYFGDANLDGKVTGDDYVAIDSNLGTGDSWIEGDFNMDGRVSGDDYVAIDSNLGNGTLDPLAFQELKAEMVSLHVSMFGEGYLAMLADAEANGFQVVPEPGSLAVLAMAAGLLARRRRDA